MPWDFKFRHYLDMVAFSVFDDFRNILFRIAERPVAIAHSTARRKFRPAFQVYPPTLVFRQVPMEDVQFVEGHRVNHLLDGCLAEEMPPFVHKASSPAELRRI